MIESFTFAWLLLFATFIGIVIGYHIGKHYRAGYVERQTYETRILLLKHDLREATRMLKLYRKGWRA